MTEPTGEFVALSFLGVTRRHVIDPRHPSFSYCGVWKGGAGSQPAEDVPELERCEGGCKNHWPPLSGSPARQEADDA